MYITKLAGGFLPQPEPLDLLFTHDESHDGARQKCQDPDSTLLTAYPRSWSLLNGLKIVPVNISLQPMPLSIITLQHRTLSPAVERFIACAREEAKLVAT